MIRFTIPGEPVAQGRPRAGKSFGGKTVLYDPTKSRNFKQFVSLIATQHKPESLLTGPVMVTADIYRSIPLSWSKKKQVKAAAGEIRPITKPDCSNIIKGIEDALNKIIWRDDSQVVSLTVRKWYSENPRVDIEIKEIDV